MCTFFPGNADQFPVCSHDIPIALTDAEATKKVGDRSLKEILEAMADAFDTMRFDDDSDNLAPGENVAGMPLDVILVVDKTGSTSHKKRCIDDPDKYHIMDKGSKFYYIISYHIISMHWWPRYHTVLSTSVARIYLDSKGYNDEIQAALKLGMPGHWDQRW